MKMKVKTCEIKMLHCYSIISLLLLVILSPSVHAQTGGTSNDVQTKNKPASATVVERWPELSAHQPPTSPTLIKNNDSTTNDYQADDDANYVFEDMDLLQNDQASGRAYTYGNMKKQMHERRDPDHNSPHRDDNILYTKEVHIRQGPLKGIVRTMHAQSGLKSVDQYLGIPYAAPPIGSGRFMPPGAPPPWKGLKRATKLSPVCPQMLPKLNNSHNQISSGRYDQLKRLLNYLKDESEDCLFLNLYVPKWSGIGPRPIYPVIVFIHGESYEWNSGNAYDGSVLASYGQVIVVTLNYRLGILGFWKPGTTDQTISNFGLLDQIAALQWVKDNIGTFGGDIGAVTLMGHGTGAACVNFLMLSPVARGLFHRAILMSGSALSGWALSSTLQRDTVQILHKLNCPLEEENDEMLKCLRKRRYQDILAARQSISGYTTTLGPVVDNSVVPDQPYKIMSQYNGMFSRYDLLFGLTEMESYHALNAVGLSHGLLESERDAYLRNYMQNRFEIRSQVAFALTLQEYMDIYTNPERPSVEEHRDTVLEILSDAEVAAPLVQTGLFQSKVNPRSYMYVFAHNSKAGEFANLPQSVVGEDLPYVFGAPLASVDPFQNRFSTDERLLSEAIMVYWTNFVKTGNPKAPWRDHFLNLDPLNWARYDIDWPDFNAGNLNYLNIGIPPVVNQNYRNRYMVYWNQQLPSELNRTMLQRKPPPFGDLHASNPTRLAAYASSSSPSPPGPHVIYYSDKTTEDPIRMLQYLLQHSHLNRSDLHQIQSTAGTEVSADASAATPSDHTYVIGDNQITVKADSTLNYLIGMVIIFLIINAIIISIYVIRRNYYSRKMKRKLDVLTLDGTTDDDLKRSMKFNDGDESFILDIVRRKNEYVPVKRYHSPINGFLLSRNYSTSTVDTHTKVSDWISQEVNRQSLKEHDKKMLTMKKHDKVNVAIDATPNGRADSTLRRHPVELMKSKSFDCSKDMIICQDVDIRRDLLDSVHLREAHRAISIPSLKEMSPPPRAEILRIDHRTTRSDPVSMQYHRPPCDRNEDITSFIEDVDVNVTSRDECDGAATHFPLSPHETLQIIQMRNYPKVLPKYPENCSEYVSTSSFKRRSMPSHQCLVKQLGRVVPAPPPRTTSTLGRNASIRSNSSNLSDLLVTTSPVQRAVEPPTLDEEPEIEYNVLHVGPLLPGSKENLYSTIRRPVAPTSQRPTSPIGALMINDTHDTGDTVAITMPDDASDNVSPTNDDNSKMDSSTSVKPPSGYKSKDDRTSLIPQLKPNAKSSLSRSDLHDSNRPFGSVAVDATGSKIPTLRNSSSSSGSGSSNETNSSSSSKNSSVTTNSDNASSEGTASSTGTIKHLELN